MFRSVKDAHGGGGHAWTKYACWHDTGACGLSCSHALANCVSDPILKLLIADGVGGNGLRTAFYRNGARGYRIQILTRVSP